LVGLIRKININIMIYSPLEQFTIMSIMEISNTSIFLFYILFILFILILIHPFLFQKHIE